MQSPHSWGKGIDCTIFCCSQEVTALPTSPLISPHSAPHAYAHRPAGQDRKHVMLNWWKRGGGVNSWRSHTVHCKVVKCLLKGQDEDNIQVWVIGNIWQFCKKRRSHYKEFAFKRTTHFLNKHYNVVKRSLDVLCRADKKKKKKTTMGSRYVENVSIDAVWQEPEIGLSLFYCSNVVYFKPGYLFRIDA